jgi:enediyne biosynthesis protein E4
MTAATIRGSKVTTELIARMRWRGTTQHTSELPLQIWCRLSPQRLPEHKCTDGQDLVRLLLLKRLNFVKRGASWAKIRTFMRRRGALLLLLLTPIIGSTEGPPSPLIKFEDVAGEAGMTVPHLSSPEKRYIIESMSGGVGFLDCNQDGRLDAITVNGSSVDRYRAGGDPMITLYEQGAESKYTDITQSSGVSRKGWGMGVAVADYDNDGNHDIYVTGFGGNVLYRGLGKCKFEDTTEKAGVRAGGFSTGAAWADYDRDGDVDLFVPRYVVIDIDKLPEFGSDEKTCRFRGIPVQCGPWGLPGESDFLFRNRGDGTFEEVSRTARVDDATHYYGMQAVWADYDNDGWPDLYVANDAGPNYLYRNRRNGTFEDVGLLSGAALSGDGQEQGSMGVDFGDFDHDGLLDIFVTNFTEEPNTLYWNRNAQGFTDISWNSRLAQASYPLVGWGTAFVDLENDGWQDLFVANGHVYPQLDLVKGGAPYRQPILIFQNNGDRTFKDVTSTSGLSELPPASRRGAAFADVDNDGDTDVLILNVGSAPALLLNRTEGAGHSVLFRLLGTKSNRAAVGTRVTVTSGTAIQFDEVRGGASYLSQNDLRLHFGLGKEAAIKSVEITWPNGNKEMLQNLAADFIYTVVEGEGVQDKFPLVARPGPAKQQVPTTSLSK